MNNIVHITSRNALSGRVTCTQVVHRDPEPAGRTYLVELVTAVVFGLAGTAIYLAVVILGVSL